MDLGFAVFAGEEVVAIKVYLAVAAKTSGWDTIEKSSAGSQCWQPQLAC